MFTDKAINYTEHRAALHIALRNNERQPIIVDGVDILPGIEQERDRVKILPENIRTRKWRKDTTHTWS